MQYIWHKSVGNPCSKCGQAASLHVSDYAIAQRKVRDKNREAARAPRKRKQIWHVAIGDPCHTCKEPAEFHMSDVIIQRRQERDQRRARRQGRQPIIGIDGEGHDLPDGSHVYTLLCAVDETGKIMAEVENQDGLSTLDCVKMLLELPRDALKFVFMGSYDWTKIIEDLKPEDIYCIMHPDVRRLRICKSCSHRYHQVMRKCPKCGSNAIRSVLQLQRTQKDKFGNKMRYGFDWMNGSFTVAEPAPSKGKWLRTTKVWDCFKFFQSSFVKAIEAWDVGTKEQHDRIKKMKKKRGEFAQESPDEIRLYCREECWLLAQMMRKLITACKTADIELKRYDGAGAIANALLKREGIKEFLGPPLESRTYELQNAVMSAYFGGRFENSVIGFVNETIHNRDIFSAYPYAIASQLPCLKCGKWYKTDNIERVKAATLGVIHYRVKTATKKERQNIAWMPLPFRTDEGSICFPTGSEGWAWRCEFDAAKEGWPEWVEFIEAFVYENHCDHKPFSWMPAAYRKRMEWGKDGAGIVMKLGTNACAGKTMQNAGESPPFKSWIWGGMITATTRAQALRAIIKAKDRWNILAIATDGIFTTEHLELDKPDDTGTFDLSKPLGGWGGEDHPNVFFVKPGMYYSLEKTVLRARGIGRDDIDYYLKLLLNKFKKWDRRSELRIKVDSRRFYGARSSILMYSHCQDCDKNWPGHPLKGCPKCGKVGSGSRCTHMLMADKKTPAYGRWAKRKIFIEFTHKPKREAIGMEPGFGRLLIRDMGGEKSIPYLGVTTPEGEMSREAMDDAMEQPDWSDSDVEQD